MLAGPLEEDRVEYRVLGKLEVLREGAPVDLGAFRQRALLALLLTAPNSVFSTDQILDELWGADGGIDKQNALWVYVSGLRKVLEPDREKRTEGTILLTRAPGYQLSVDPDDVDASRFERLVAEGRALSHVDPAAASLVLGEALALWRGRAFEDFTYESFAQVEIARLEELRLEAVQLRIDADLERGLDRELISELESLVRQHPLNERLSAQLMLALYRCGRQADALRVYRILKSRLGEELGIEPSASVRSLESQMVTGDQALDHRPSRPETGIGPGPGPAVRGYELREQLGADAGGVAFRAYQPAVGREVALKVIRADLANDPGFIRRFQSEAQVVATLEHPHIVPLYDYWREPDAAYLVTPLMRGGSLAAVLADGPLTISQTATIVDQVGDALRTAHRAGLVHGDVHPRNVFLDSDGNAYLSDFGIATGHEGPRSDVRGLGLLVATALTGTEGNFDALRAILPNHVAEVIDRAVEQANPNHYDRIDELVSELQEALRGGVSPAPVARTSPPTTGANPYKGLRAFDTLDAADFFGRERLVERLIARLGRVGSRGRFVAVVGPSGSGKSSAVKAGLLPAIRRGALPLSGTWFATEMTPAPHPFEQLEEALLAIAVDSPPSLLDLLAGDNGIRRAFERALPQDGSHVVLLIDQFEELFTQVDAVTAERFIDSIVSAVTDDRSRVRIIVTLRADFYDRPLQRRGLGELLRDGTEIITPMGPNELELAITQPARQRGASCEPALVAALLRDVADRPGALPLLQYTLTELFENRRDGWMTYAAYEQLGGISSALVKRADGLLSSLGEGADEVARQVFLRLIALTEGGDDTRRRVLRNELEDLAVDRRQLRRVLDTFGRHRLLSFDRDPVTRSPTVEISHEALLSEWSRLREWIDAARDDVRMQRRLAEALREWEAADRSDTYLIRGGLLEQLHGWSASTSLELSGPERAFLDRSVAERDREEEEVAQRERRATAAERNQRRRARQLVAVGLVTILVAALGTFGIVQWRSAVASKDDVEDLLAVADLVAASDAVLTSDPELALLLAMQSVGATVETGYAAEEAVDAVHFALQELGVHFDVDASTPIALRTGPRGPTGVYALTPHELMAYAESAVTRTLSAEECETYFSAPCPPHVEVPSDLALRRGLDAYGAGIGTDGLAGSTVRVSAASGGIIDDGFTLQLAEFSRLTGIRVEQTSVEALAEVNFESVEPALRPDVVVVANEVPEWARGRAIDLTRFLDSEVLRSDYGLYLLRVGTWGIDGTSQPDDGRVVAVPLKAEVKGIVFYPKAEFEQAGYVVPTTWDELIELSDRIVADGGSPWCFGFEAGVATGWPGTDLIESLVLRTGGADAYDAWTRGEVGFTSADVLEAGRLANTLMFSPAYVRGGPVTVNGQSFADQLAFMLARDEQTGETEPECWLYHQAAFALNFAPAGSQLGTDLDFFVLPPVDADQPTPMIGTANFASAIVDRPEVRALMEFMASPQWGEAWARHGPTVFTPANRRFDTSNFGDPALDPSAAVYSRLATAAVGALQSEAFRFDASDLMPPAIGAAALNEAPGAFWQGMIDWTAGKRTIEQVFADIDAAWAELRAQGGSQPPDP